MSDKDSDHLIFVMMKLCGDAVPAVKYCLKLSHDLSWTLHYKEQPTALSPNILTPLYLSSSTELVELMKRISSAKMCKGYSDSSWHDLKGWKKGKFLNKTG